jgi:hypothetical protein
MKLLYTQSLRVWQRRARLEGVKGEGYSLLLKFQTRMHLSNAGQGSADLKASPLPSAPFGSQVAKEIRGPAGQNLLPSWDHLGPSWGHLRASWAALGPSWAALGPSWGHPGSILGHLGVILGHLGIMFGHFGAILESTWLSCGHLAHLGLPS